MWQSEVARRREGTAQQGGQAIGRSRGGPSSKLHALVADACTALIMDRADHGDQTRQLARELGDRPVVPPPSYRNPSWAYDRTLDRRRNEVDRCFGRLKRFRRIATLYDKLEVIFLSFIHHALIWDARQLL